MKPASGVADDYHPWTTYIAAREEARRWGDRRVGTDHLVLGLLRDPEIAGALGVTLDTARAALASLDERALASVGIDVRLNAPPLPERELPARPTIKAVVTDRLPLTPAAKSALQEAGKPLRRRQHITPQQVLLVLLENRRPDPAATLLAALGVSVPAARARLVASPAA
ncbi:MAG: Clp protease N-terminal domain-containing protein [Acidimicrobiales bacterium]